MEHKILLLEKLSKWNSIRDGINDEIFYFVYNIWKWFNI